MGPLGWFISGYLAKDLLGSDEKKEKFKLKDKADTEFFCCDEPDDEDEDEEDDEDEEEDDDED